MVDYQMQRSTAIFMIIPVRGGPASARWTLPWGTAVLRAAVALAGIGLGIYRLPLFGKSVRGNSHAST